MRLRRYAHLSTGNYNARSPRGSTPTSATSRASDALTADIDAVFQQLASLGRTMPPLKAMLQAPFTLHKADAGGDSQA